MKNSRHLLIGMLIGAIAGVFSYSIILDSNTISATPNDYNTNHLSNHAPTDLPETIAEERKQGGAQDTTRKANTLMIKSQRNKSASTGMNQARGITRLKADSLFQEYHLTRDPSRSRGVVDLNIDGDKRKLTHYFLSYDKVIIPLFDKLDTVPDSTLVGFAGIMGFDSLSNSNTMMWVAVVQDKNNEYQYYLPSDDQPNNKSHIYDFIDVCPKYCPKNYDQLWREDWE